MNEFDLKWTKGSVYKEVGKNTEEAQLYWKLPLICGLNRIWTKRAQKNACEKYGHTNFVEMLWDLTEGVRKACNYFGIGIWYWL